VTDQPPERKRHDPELDAAVLRVPHWRALSLTAALLVLAVPVLWYLAAERRSAGTWPAVDWLDGSSWRLVEIERRAVAAEVPVSFRAGRLVIEAAGCAPVSAAYRATTEGIVLSDLPPPVTGACANPAVAEAVRRLPAVDGLTRYGWGMALVDRNGRDLMRLKR
jgi:hypothetical protein